MFQGFHRRQVQEYASSPAVMPDLDMLHCISQALYPGIRLLLQRFGNDIRLYATSQQIGCRPHRSRCRIGITEPAAVSGNPGKQTHCCVLCEIALHFFDDLINDFCSSCTAPIEIELFGLIIVGNMMIDIQDRCLDDIGCLSYPVQTDIQRDQQIRRDALSFLRFPYKLISRQHRKCCRDIIIDENLRILAQAAQKMHQSQRRTDGITIRVHMGCDDDLLCRLDGLCSFPQ